MTATTSLDRLYLEHEPRIRSVGRSMLPPCEVDDFVHDVVIHAAEPLHQLRNPNREAAWVGSIARRRALDQLRLDSRRATICVDDAPDPLQADLVDCALAAVTIHESRPRWQRLPPLTRRALLLLADGNSYQQTAQELDISVSNLKTLVYRGRRAMGRHDRTQHSTALP